MILKLDKIEMKEEEKKMLGDDGVEVGFSPFTPTPTPPPNPTVFPIKVI